MYIHKTPNGWDGLAPMKNIEVLSWHLVANQTSLHKSKTRSRTRNLLPDFAVGMTWKEMF